MRTSAESWVCVVEDEAGVRRLIRDILEETGWPVHSYASAEAFLSEFDEAKTACVVTDLHMPGINGFELQHRLTAMGSVVAVIVLTGNVDVRTVVRLMEDGVLTLLEKPFQQDELVAAVRRSIEVTDKRRRQRDERWAVERRLAQLSDDERAMLNCLIAGLPNKAIATKLGLSMRTVDRRRSTVLHKMQAASPTELATLMGRLKSAGR